MTAADEKRVLSYLIALLQAGYQPLERSTYEFAEPFVRPSGPQPPGMKAA